MVQGVIFDMDGVLVDSEHFYQQRRETFLQRMEFPIPKEMNFIGSNEKSIWEMMVPDDALLWQEMMRGYRAYRKLHPVNYKKADRPSGCATFCGTEKVWPSDRHRIFLITVRHSANDKSNRHHALD